MADATVLMLVLQGLLLTGSIVLARGVLLTRPDDDRADHVTDVWIPIIIILPLLAAVRSLPGESGAASWLPVGAPVDLALLLAGVSLIGSRGTALGAIPVSHFIGWSATGAVLLMLAAAHDLTAWVGQSCFALAAVLLWMNSTPAIPSAEETRRTGENAAAPLILAACVFGQGAIALAIEPAAMGISRILLLVHGAAASVVTGLALRRGHGLRAAGWVATIGVLAGIGTISFAGMIERLVQLFGPTGGRELIAEEVAFGFGPFALEGLLLLALPPLLGSWSRAHPSSVQWARLIGFALTLAGIALIAVRIAAASAGLS